MIETRIMDVPKRKAFVDRLASQLQLPAKDIILDTRGENGGGECWTTCRTALLSLCASGASHGIICQGDVRVCNDFYKYAELCRDFRPDAIWSFCWWGRFHDVVKEYDTPFVRAVGGQFTTQCYMIPTKYIPAMVEEIEWIYGTNKLYDDALRLVWSAMHNHIPIYVSVPCLAQHLTKQVSSTFGFTQRGKYPRYNLYYQDDVSWANWSATHEAYTKAQYPFRYARKNSPDYQKITRYCDEAERWERSQWVKSKRGTTIHG